MSILALMDVKGLRLSPMYYLSLVVLVGMNMGMETTHGETKGGIGRNHEKR